MSPRDSVSTSAGNGLAGSLGLRAGEWVIVRSKEEILATLDRNATLDGLPFQPEMFAWCGRRMRVWKVAHKTCDTIHKTGGRSMRDTVHLDGARCDGSFHGGCQADCLFFWKEAWLRREREGAGRDLAEPQCTEELVQIRSMAQGTAIDPEPTWICQTTALFEASGPLAWWDLRQYLRDVTTGNHSAWHVFTLLLGAGYRALVSRGRGFRPKIAFYNWIQRIRRGTPYPHVEARVPFGAPTPSEHLDLHPGEWVEVKSADEIGATINPDGMNRGMRYDVEMLKYSGGTYRVQRRVERLIDEKTGKMLRMKTPCVQLEAVYCRAECTARRLGCPRASSTYWREIWLRRAVSPGGRPGA